MPQTQPPAKKWLPKATHLLLLGLVLLGTGCGPDKSAAILTDKTAYMLERNRIVHEEEAMNPATQLKLTDDELTAERYLQSLKKAEIKRTAGNFPPAQKFLLVKDTIDASPLMPIFKKMPKGAILHVHPGAIQDLHWLIANATYRPDCYIYLGVDNDTAVQGQLALFAKPPGGAWRPVEELRAAADDKRKFDDGLYQDITLGPEDLGKGDIWLAFEKCWSRVGDLEENHHLYEAFGKRELTTAIEDNVQLVELRAFLGGPIADDGKSAGLDSTVRLYKKWMRAIQLDNPEFELKIIYTRERAGSPSAIADYLNNAIYLRKTYPDFVVGFDLVNEEDRSHALLDFLDEFLAANRAAKEEGIDLPYFFHAGESNWTNNTNTLDAIVLGSKRIGHGLALIKHPRLLQLVKERGIAIEVCPISNQVLGYVSDLRNHPAVNWIRSGIPVVLSPDDPGMMQAGFAYDFYEAFMAWDLDLRDIKQLILNSIEHSSLNPDEKKDLRHVWEGKWIDFIWWVNDQAEKAKLNPTTLPS